MIREVELNNVRVTLSGFPGAPTETLRLDPIVLRNVGSDTHHGLVMSELAAVVVSAVFASLLERPDQLPGMIVSGLGEGLQHVGGLAEQGIAAIGGLSEGARAALQEVGVPLEEARDVLRGLLRSRGDD